MNAHNEVRVYVRTRPTAQFAQELIEYLPDKQTVNVHQRKISRKVVLNNQMSSWSFPLNGVLHNISQEEVYQQVAHSVVLGALEGYNGTRVHLHAVIHSANHVLEAQSIKSYRSRASVNARMIRQLYGCAGVPNKVDSTVMCFGQTGAGKTYTMTGATESFKQRGIIPRAIQEVFQEIENRVEHTFSVYLSFLEIYNETLVDLLASVKGGQTKHCGTLAVVEDPEGGVSVKGLSLHPVHREEEALNLLFEGEMNKIIGEHALNKNSSRSHCIFTVHIESRSRTLSNATYITSKLNLVDLAGSERLSKTGSEGQVQREALYINKSLSFLEQAILALADRRREHVPFRQSKLTHALKDSLGGNCNTVLVANIYGEAEQIDETLSTLRFAARMKCVCTEPSLNTHIDPSLQVQALQKEIQLLKQELSFQNTLANRAAVTYDDLSEAQLAVVKSEVQSYLAGTLDEITTVSVRQIQEVFVQFKKAFQERERQFKAEKSILVKKTPSTLSMSDAKEPVAEMEGENRLTVPASSQRQPVSPGRSKGKKAKESSRKNGQVSADPGDRLTTTQSETEILVPPNAAKTQESAKDDAMKRCDTPPSKMEAFEIYKSEKGHEINRILKENKSVLKERLAQLHNLTGIINSIKRDIDHMCSELQLYREEAHSQGQMVSADGEPVLDEAEVTLLIKLRGAKDQYRQNYEELLSTKAEVQYCRHLVDQCRMRLFSEFESWYNESFLLPDEVLAIFKDGGPIRPGLVPVDKALALEGDEQEHAELLGDSPSAMSFYNAYNRTVQRRAPHCTVSRTSSMGPDTDKLKSLATFTRRGR